MKFNKKRDFEQLIAGTFDFIKQEFKPLLKALLTYAGPLILITTLIFIKFYPVLLDILNADPKTIGESNFSVIYFILLLSILASHSFLFLTVYAYIRLYIEKGKDNFEIEEIWQLIKNKFTSIFSAFLIITFIIIIGLIFFIIPGVYFAVLSSLVFPIIVFEEQTFGQAINKSIKLIKNYWLFTFALLIVIYIITLLAGIVFSLPKVIITSQTPQITITLLNLFGGFFSTLLYAVPYITIVLHYFSQIENQNENY